MYDLLLYILLFVMTLPLVGPELELKYLILSYADDTVLMAESHVYLQNIFNKFGEYYNAWRLKANMDITKIMFVFQWQRVNTF